MVEMTFEVGDRVRVVQEDSLYYGLRGRVWNVRPDGRYDIERDCGGPIAHGEYGSEYSLTKEGRYLRLRGDQTP